MQQSVLGIWGGTDETVYCFRISTGWRFSYSFKDTWSHCFTLPCPVFSCLIIRHELCVMGWNLSNMGTYFVLQLQVWTEGTVTTLLVLVQAAVEFRLDWILFPQHHSEVDLLRTKRQLLRVHLNEWREIERNFKAQVSTVEEENKTKSTHTDLNTFSVERYNINRTPWWPSGARQTRAAESSDLK